MSVECSLHLGPPLAASEPADCGLLPGLTLVICTYGRPQSMLRFLESVPGQDLPPRQLIVVDASRDNLTELEVRGWAERQAPQFAVWYLRVAGKLRGLTRQRAVGLRCTRTTLLGFMDDDVVLLPGCLREVVRAFDEGGSQLVGVGAWIAGSTGEVPALWRTRRRLGIIPELRPGAYARTGFSLPWTIQPRTEEIVPADWLSGCSMCWRTDVAKRVGFSTQFIGYSAGEDLEFSLLMRQHGRLVVAGQARVEHLQDPAQRPRNFVLGYTGARNAYFIHRTCLPDRTWRDGVRFAIAYWGDTLARCAANVLRLNFQREVWRLLAGRIWFLVSYHAWSRRLGNPPRLTGVEARFLPQASCTREGLPSFEDFPEVSK